MTKGKRKNNSRKHNSVGSKYVRRHGRLVKFRGRQKTRDGVNLGLGSTVV